MDLITIVAEMFLFGMIILNISIVLWTLSLMKGELSDRNMFVVTMLTGALIILVAILVFFIHSIIYLWKWGI